MESIRLPEHWNNWQITEEIGAGSYGVVYRAEAEGNNNVDAIKVIRVPRDKKEASSLYREYGSMEEVSRYYSKMVSDLVDEIQTLMALKGCSNIVQIKDYHVERTPENEYGWIIYIRMEYLQSLPDYLQEHETDEEGTIQLGIDLCKALEECEKAGIIHRDIKPDNILVSKDGEFKIGDFGVAKRLEANNTSYSMKGTFSYMSPEIYYGRPYDQRTDIYSLGLVLYRMLNYNREPFVDLEKQIIYFRDKEKAMGERMAGTPVPPPALASKEMAEVIQIACAFHENDRYTCARDMRNALEKVKNHTYIVGEGHQEKGDVEVSPSTELTDQEQESLRILRSKENEKEAVQAEPSAGNKDKSGFVLTRKMKAVLIISLVLLIAIAGAEAYSLITSRTGTIFKGESCSQDGDATCTLYKDGRLVIKGTGTIGDPSGQGPLSPWEAYSDEVKEIVIEEGITGINEQAFNSCMFLTNVQLPESIRSIGDNVFDECGMLRTINIPEDIRSIGYRAFYGTKWLELAGDDEGYVIVNGILLAYSGQKDTLKLPENVTIINDGAFESNTDILDVTLPEKLKEIRDFAFSDCEKLTYIRGLEGNTNIIYIGMEAFMDTKWLENLLAKGKGYAIADHRLLAYKGQDKTVIIPDDVETITGCAFGDNYSMENVVLPSSVKEIGEQTFYACTNLKSITFEGCQIRAIPDLTFFECPRLTEISLPDTVESIGISAFYNCSSLETIRLSKNLKEIAEDAFVGCANLREVEQVPALDKTTIKTVFGGTLWYEKKYSSQN